MNIYELSGLLIAITSGLMSVLMFFFGKTNVQYLWGRFCVFVLIFGIGIYFVAGAKTAETADLWWRVAHIGAIFIPVLFLHFVYEFLEINKTKLLSFFYILSFIFLFADFAGDLFISNMRFVFGQFFFDSPPGILYVPYTIMFFGLTFYSHYLLWQGYKQTNDRLKKERIKYFFIGMAISFAGGGFNFLPVFGIDIYPFMNIMVFIYPLIISYAIFKHDLFDVKTLATGLFVFVQVAALVVMAILSKGLLANVISYSVFFGTILIGYFLIRSVQQEVDSRKEIELLAGSLEEANSKLKEIDLRKNDFINIASHQLRTPMTAVKGYSTLLVDGAYGDFDPKIKEIISRINGLTDQSVKIINDMLNISRIERNTMRYVFEKVDIVEFLTEILKNLKLKADAKNLQYEYVFDEKLSNVENKIYVNVDKTLLAQVFENVVDNSIKYTLKGYVKIDIKLKGKKLIFNCVDSGIGIDKESQASLFKKFTRAKNAEGSGIEGSGIGLYLAKEIMTKHKGDISIFSEGENKGSQTLITLSI